MKWLSRYENSTKPQARRTCRTPMPRKNLGGPKPVLASIKRYSLADSAA